jgi:hypothetical protein
MEANVQKNDLFWIESERSGNKWSLNGQGIAAVGTPDATEAQAKMTAHHAAPGDSLRLDLDFRWALSDLKVCASQK